MLGFYFDPGISTAFQLWLVPLDQKTKGRLGCVSKYWQRQMHHPAFWPDVVLPGSSLVRVKDTASWLEKNSSRFNGVQRFVWPQQFASTPPRPFRIIITTWCPMTVYGREGPCRKTRASGWVGMGGGVGRAGEYLFRGANSSFSRVSCSLQPLRAIVGG